MPLRKPPPGTPVAVDPNDDTTPIELVEAHRLFDPSQEDMRCLKCGRFLSWTDVEEAWWCINILCRWYRKVPTRP